MMKTETVRLAAGAVQPLEIAGKWFRVRELVGGAEPYVLVKALSTNGGKQLADGLTAYDGDLFGWDEAFRGITFTNPTAVDVAFEVIISDEGRHEVSRPAVAIVGAITQERACVINNNADESVNAGATLTLTLGTIVSDDTYQVTVQADHGNPGPVRVGGAFTGAGTGTVLYPGESISYPVTDALGLLVVKCHNPNATPATVRVFNLDRGPA